MNAEPFRYRIIVEWSDEDEAYLGRVPAFPHLVTDGQDPNEAATEARIAAEGMLESMRDRGDPPPPADVSAEYSGQTRLRMPRSLHARLDRLATAEGVSLNVLMVSILSAGAAERPTARRKDEQRLECAEPVRSRSIRAKLRGSGARAKSKAS